MITTEVQRCGSTFLIGVSGELDAAAAPVLQQALDQVTVQERVLMIALHGVSTTPSSAWPLDINTICLWAPQTPWWCGASVRG